MGPSKKELNELYSKRRYILIDKETNSPLSFSSTSRWSSDLFKINDTDTQYRKVAIFDEPFPLINLAKDLEKNEYRFIEDFFYKKDKLKQYKKFVKAENRVVWKRLSKQVIIKNIHKEQLNTSINKTKYSLRLIDFKK